MTGRPAALVLALVLSLGVVWSSIASTESVSIALWDKLLSLDPAYTTTIDAYMVMNSLFDTLVYLDEEGRIMPAQAITWHVSDDGTTYTFKLRDDIFWSDGSPVTAEQYVAGFCRIFDPELNRTARPTYLLSNLVNADEVSRGDRTPCSLGIHAPDNGTLVFNLIEPARYFLSVLANAGLTAIPTQAIARHGNDWWRQQPYISNGPFELVSMTDQRLVLKRNPDHWFRPAFDRLVFRFYQSNDDALEDLLDGKLDIATDVRRNALDLEEHRSDLKVRKLAESGTIFLMLNTRKPKLADPQVRQAMSILIDRHRLSDALGFVPATSFTPAALWTMREEYAPDWLSLPYETRRRQARSLLASAGFDNDNPLVVRLVVSKSDEWSRTAHALKSMWMGSGIGVEISAVPRSELSSVLKAGDFDLALQIWYPDFPDPLTFLNTLDVMSTVNYSRWRNERYSDLLRQSRTTVSRQRSQKLTGRLEQIILEEVPVIPLGYVSTSVLTSSRIKTFTGYQNFVEPRTITLVD